MKILSCGAEATIYLDGETIVKERVKKAYRIPEIDTKLTRLRTTGESRILDRLRMRGVRVPAVLEVKDNRIRMEKIEGESLREVLRRENHVTLMRRVGTEVGKMHSLGIVHGDLTTSNMLVSGEEIWLIDFGLSFSSTKLEDLAVDLYVFERAVKCSHEETFLSSFYEAYEEAGPQGVLERLEDVRKRGRKREETAIG